eukprot:GEMP01048236.1.p1 GENE.GEMP01048236.1~~GEMP01048236.1.p1  ORF type:complete len:487 (+),score=135.58 GEMP01048236.1:62-1522(+)
MPLVRQFFEWIDPRFVRWIGLVHDAMDHPEYEAMTCKVVNVAPKTSFLEGRSLSIPDDIVPSTAHTPFVTHSTPPSDYYTPHLHSHDHHSTLPDNTSWPSSTNSAAHEHVPSNSDEDGHKAQIIADLETERHMQQEQARNQRWLLTQQRIEQQQVQKRKFAEQARNQQWLLAQQQIEQQQVQKRKFAEQQRMDEQRNSPVSAGKVFEQTRTEDQRLRNLEGGEEKTPLGRSAQETQAAGAETEGEKALLKVQAKQENQPADAEAVQKEVLLKAQIKHEKQAAGAETEGEKALLKVQAKQENQPADAEAVQKEVLLKAQIKHEKQAAGAETEEKDALLKAQTTQEKQVAGAKAEEKEVLLKAQAAQDKQAADAATQAEIQKEKHAKEARHELEMKKRSAAYLVSKCKELPKRDIPCALCDRLLVQKCLRRLQAWPPLRLLHDKVDPATGKPPEDLSKFLYDAAFMSDQPHAPLEVLYPVPQSGMNYF